MTAVGEVAHYRGQAYTLMRVEPYTRQRDGVIVELLTWRSVCAACGADFECTTGPSFRPVRTCEKHRRERNYLAWKHRVQVTEPAPLEPGMRPHAPVQAYEGARR